MNYQLEEKNPRVHFRPGRHCEGLRIPLCVAVSPDVKETFRPAVSLFTGQRRWEEQYGTAGQSCISASGPVPREPVSAASQNSPLHHHPLHWASNQTSAAGVEPASAPPPWADPSLAAPPLRSPV